MYGHIRCINTVLPSSILMHALRMTAFLYRCVDRPYTVYKYGPAQLYNLALEGLARALWFGVYDAGFRCYTVIGTIRCIYMLILERHLRQIWSYTVCVYVCVCVCVCMCVCVCVRVRL